MKLKRLTIISVRSSVWYLFRKGLYAAILSSSFNSFIFIHIHDQKDKGVNTVAEFWDD